MKKLIVVAAAVMLGIMAQAASVAWSVDNTYKMGTTDAAEGWVMVFFDNADVARSAFVSSLSTDGYKTYVATSGGVAFDLTDADGYADGFSLRDDYGNPETVTGYFVLFNSDEIETATYAYVSETMDATTGATAGQPANMVWGDITATQTADNWTAVPEPTSGLLLLVGGALLALKRRRA